MGPKGMRKNIGGWWTPQECNHCVRNVMAPFLEGGCGLLSYLLRCVNLNIIFTPHLHITWINECKQIIWFVIFIYANHLHLQNDCKQTPLDLGKQVPHSPFPTKSNLNTESRRAKKLDGALNHQATECQGSKTGPRGTCVA